MGLVHVKGHAYYTESIRLGDRVTSRCVASGANAFLFARMGILIRQEEAKRRTERRRVEGEQAAARKVEREALKALRERLASVEDVVAGYHRRIGETVEAILRALGYHRHSRGQWRRRRKPMGNELAKVSVAELVRLAREGDRIALGELSYRADQSLYETVEALDGDLARDVVEECLINSLGPGYYGNREGVAAKLAILRRELAPPGSSLAEELLAERAAVCWLHVQLLEMDRIDALNGSDKPPREIDYRKLAAVDQCLSRAQARFERALTALAKVRRLNLPVVINQVNVGAQVNGVQLSRG
jgi:hypothetical protein